MSECGRLTDKELMRALGREADALRSENPQCPKVLALYDCLLRKTVKGARTLAVINSVNKELGTIYDSNIHGKWRRGERGIPHPAQALMRRRVLECILGEDGLELAHFLDG